MKNEGFILIVGVLIGVLLMVGINVFVDDCPDCNVSCPACPEIPACQEFNYSLINGDLGEVLPSPGNNMSSSEPIIILDDQTFEIVDSSMQPLPEYFGSFIEEEVVVNEWDCESNLEFLFDNINYLYRDTDWFGSIKRGSAENACKSKSPHLAHHELTGVFPVDKAGHNQTQFQLIRCWYEDCYGK